MGTITFNAMDLLTTLMLFSLGRLGGHEISSMGQFILINSGMAGFIGAKLIIITVLIIAIYKMSDKWNRWSTAFLACTCGSFMIVSTLNLMQFIVIKTLIYYP